jgi:UDP-N-acetylmuramoyl-tripeptide--D-alanyl-D-alanine ligase
MSNISKLHSIFLQSNGVSTDTRTLEKGCIFFALTGDNFDGNKYAKKALEKGAQLAVVSDKNLTGDSFFHCDDVLVCLQKLANYHRNFLKLPIIAITGSNGKTTTKKLTYNVLKQKFNAKATKGNLNNHIGVPLTLLSFTEKTEIGIVEMGANHQKEIESLCQIAEPNFGYITNYGKAHLEGFGGIDGVIKGKSEMYDFINSNNGMVFVNAEDDIQLDKTKKLNRFIIGEKNADCIVTCLATQPKLKVLYKDQPIQSKLIGAYNFKNIAAAIGFGDYLKLTFEEIKEGIESFRTEQNRSQFVKSKRNTVLLDAYNANPTSMDAALHNFSTINAKKKTVILGDMFEVGKDSLKEHEVIINLAEKLQFKHILVCGNYFFEANQNLKNKVEAFQNFEKLAEFLKNKPIKDHTILIKGSRGMALERCLALL